jgi:O-antigen ligase
VALALGAIGLAVASLLPPPVALAGYACYLVAVGLDPWVAIPLIILALPFSARPQMVGPIEISTAEMATLLGAVVIGAVAVRRSVPSFNRPGSRGEGEWATQRPTGADWAAAAFLGAGLVSLLVTEQPKQSLRELRWVIVEPIIFFLLARATLTTPARIRVALWSVVAAGVVAATASLVAAAASDELLTLATRPGFPYPSPNHLGLFLGRAAAVAAAIAFFGMGRNTSQAWAGVALVPIGLALLRSLSLGAWIGVSGAVLALAALKGRRWLVGTALGLIVALTVIAVALPRERTFGRFDPGSGTGLFRLQIWESSLRMVADHPLLGVGLDNFLYQYRDRYMLPEAWEEPNISHPHNWILHFWLALGVPGLVAAIGMTVWLVARARALFARPLNQIDRTVGAAAIATLVDTLLHGSFDNSYFLFDAAMLWWLIAALLTAAATSDKDPSGASQRQSRTMGPQSPLMRDVG